jgi:hypothetical protein
MRTRWSRSLYLLLLRLHPAEFRRRFADEMLAIFDQAAPEQGKAGLLADGALSVLRQRLADRPQADAPVAAGIYQEIATSHLTGPRFVQAGVVAAGLLFAFAMLLEHAGGRPLADIFPDRSEAGDGYLTAPPATRAVDTPEPSENGPSVASGGAAAVAGVLAAFRHASVVVLDDRRGDLADANFRLAVLDSPGIVSTVQDIVVGFASARYQDVLDRYIDGQDVSPEQLAKVWRDTTEPGCCDAPMYAAFLKAVRERNRGLSPQARLRVLAADPPIDWQQVRSASDWDSYLYQRDAFASGVIEHEVIARHRKALVVMDASHFYRNDPWSPDNVTTEIESAYPRSVYVVLALGGRGPEYDTLRFDMKTSTTPAFASLRGTSMANLAADPYFPGRYGRHLGGRVVDSTSDRFPQRRLGDIADAFVDLGPERAAPVARDASSGVYRGELARRLAIVQGRAVEP